MGIRVQPGDPAPVSGTEKERPSFVSSAGLGGEGVYIGREAAGGSFAFDPWLLAGRDLVGNPDLLVAGDAGQGKTSLVITYLWRQQVFGRRACVVDTTGAYRPLAEQSDGELIRLDPGGGVRLNPLDAGPAEDLPGQAEHVRRRAATLASLLAAVLRRSLTPTEARACQVALEQVAGEHGDAVTIPQVVEGLLQPSVTSVRVLGPAAQAVSMAGRHLALALRSAVRRHLGGLFDEPTSSGSVPRGPVTVVDVASVPASRSTALVLYCAAAWLRSSLAENDALILVLDDASALLAEPAVAAALLACRDPAAPGLSTVMVGRLPPTPPSPGERGAGAPARSGWSPAGLAGLFGTRVLHHLSPEVLRESRGPLDLEDDEADLLPTLAPGEALWKVGSRSYLVTHHIGDHEWPLLAYTQAGGSSG